MKKLNILQKLIALVIDASSAFFIFEVIALILSYIYFLPFLPGYWAVWTTYYVVCYCCFGRTLGQAFFQARIVENKGKLPTLIRITLRESLTSLPAIIFWTTCCTPIIPTWSLVILTVCLLLSFLRTKLFGIRIRRFDVSPVYRPCLIYLVFIILGPLALITNIACTGDREVLQKAPFNATPRPSVNLVNEYVDFLKNNRQNINDYIMGLFNKYDHVILCERTHPEMTQYEMIYNLVTDDRFVDSVGVVFTEVGNVESRETYRNLTNTTFVNDTLMEKALASFLMDNQTVWLLWTPTNSFDFLKKMYYFNHDKKKKVEIMFSDRNWLDRSQLNVRDSIMADNIISTIDSAHIKKSLIIMNYRHAFLTQGNVGYYVNRKYPGKVANVMINTPNAAQLYLPIQNGKWDAAMEQVRPIEYAINFKGSPFGEDKFDYALFCTKFGIKYKDMFTGIIFYKSNNEQYISDGYRYITEPDNLKKIEDRSRLLPEDAQNPYVFPNRGILVRNSFDVYGFFMRFANLAIVGTIIFSLLLDVSLGFYTYRLRKQRTYQS